MNKYKLLKMLQSSNINKQIGRMVEIFDSLQKKNIESAYMQLRSLQFCSLFTVKKLQQQKEKEIKHIEDSLAEKLKKFEQENLVKNEQLKCTITNLEQRNSIYKVNLYKTGCKNIWKQLNSIDLKYKYQAFAQIRQYTSSRHVKIIKSIKDSSSRGNSFKESSQKVLSSPNMNSISFKDDQVRRENLSKEKVINEILNQESKYFESSKSNFNYSLNNRVETESNKEIRIASHKATEIKESRNKLLLASPSSQNRSHKASLFTNRNYQSSPGSSKENSQLNANSDFGNFERRDNFNKLSSTAAFKTLTSSPNKMFQSDSPGSERIQLLTQNLGPDEKCYPEKWLMLSADYYKNLDEIILNPTYND